MLREISNFLNLILSPLTEVGDSSYVCHNGQTALRLFALFVASSS